MNNIIYCLDKNYLNYISYVFDTFKKFHDFKKYTFYFVLTDNEKKIKKI
jgi:hypothetical protein